jgi:hypothetical protein
VTNLSRATAAAMVCSVALALSACTTSSSPAPTAPVSAAVSPLTARPMKLTGTAVYLARTDTDLVLHSVRGGTDTVTSASTGGGGVCPYNSVVVSPDGKRLAWVSTLDISGKGELVVSDVSGANLTILPVNSRCLGNNAVIWLVADQISVTPSDRDGRVLVDSTTGKWLAEEDRISGAWSDDGAWLATVNGDGKPIVMPKGKPGAARPYAYTPPADQAEHYDGWSARSVSVDGRYVAVGWNGTDPSRQLGTFAVVDTRTGAVVNLPVQGDVSSVHFLADGTVLVRSAGQISLLDKDFTVLGQATEPASVHDLPLLRYIP